MNFIYSDKKVALDIFLGLDNRTERGLIAPMYRYYYIRGTI